MRSQDLTARPIPPLHFTVSYPMQLLNNASYLMGALISLVIVLCIFNFPLYAFLKLSGRYPDRKPESVIWLNFFAFIFVVGVFGYTAIIDINEMRTVYTVCAIIFAFPYLLNMLLAYKFKRSYVAGK